MSIIEFREFDGSVVPVDLEDCTKEVLVNKKGGLQYAITYTRPSGQKLRLFRKKKEWEGIPAKLYKESIKKATKATSKMV